MNAVLDDFRAAYEARKNEWLQNLSLEARSQLVGMDPEEVNARFEEWAAADHRSRIELGQGQSG
jgi:hypothetical protein